MNNWYLIIGMLIVGVLVWMGAITFPMIAVPDITISTNESSTTYNLEGLPWGMILSPQFLGIIILIILSAFLLFWAMNKYGI